MSAEKPTEIATLLQTHAAAIAELRNLTADVFPPKPEVPPLANECQYDDIYLLRFILSFKTAKDAAPEVRMAMKLRTDSEWAPIIRLVRNNPDLPPGVWPLRDTLHQYSSGFLFRTLMKDGSPFIIARPAMTDVKSVFGKFTSLEYKQLMLAERERAFMQCDRVAREQGRLVKMYALIDMKGTSLGTSIHPQLNKLGGEVSELCSHVYPQLLGKVIFTNPPGFFAFGWSIAKVFFSKRVVDKCTLCGSKDTTKEPVSKCPFVTANVNIDQLPHFLGGNLKEEDMPQVLRQRVMTEPDPTTTVAARSTQTLSIAVGAGTSVDWCLALQGYGIVLSAKLEPVAVPAVTLESVTASAGVAPKGSNGGASPSVVEIQAPVHLKAAEGAHKGTWGPFAEPGMLWVTFDNTHSMLRSKSFQFTHTVRESKASETADKLAASFARLETPSASNPEAVSESEELLG